jgi:signal transduction histidine kinase
MVSSILDFGRLRKHQLTVLSRPIFLNQTVDFLLPSFHPQLKPGVALVNRISEQFPAALGDEVKLEQILHNLIQNALQHTESGTITLEAELRDQQILLTVRDTGQGIAPHKLAQLFSPFHQVSEIDTRATGGLGLGLAISNELIQLMGGRLELQSKEGVGTTAVLWLPLCPPTKSQYF